MAAYSIKKLRQEDRVQCIQYALDRPGVLTVLPGIRGKEDLKELLKYVDATPEEKTTL